MDVNSQCPKLANLAGERILIFGGSGSLGKTSVTRWIKENEVINVSRDEEKQWLLKTQVCNAKLVQMIGDISIEDDVASAILTYKPTIVCIFACLKHIDLCEKFPNKSMSINTNGILNVHTVLQKYPHGVKQVLFVSTDKACMPITTYGCSKAIAESFLQGVRSETTKWIGVRYGNVLNSSGSIIPYLCSNKCPSNPYTLTHRDMTRFIMTLDQSVNLLEYAITYGKHNEIIVPFIYSMKIADLFGIFETKYNKQTIVTGLRCKEKINEDLISPTESKNTYSKDGYFHITPHEQPGSDSFPFDSSKNIITKELLQSYLGNLGFL
jgi:UDP-glucose 4-epimerase